MVVVIGGDADPHTVEVEQAWLGLGLGLGFRLGLGLGVELGLGLVKVRDMIRVGCVASSALLA